MIYFCVFELTLFALKLSFAQQINHKWVNLLNGLDGLIRV